MPRFRVVASVLALAGCTGVGGVDTVSNTRTPPDAKSIILANKGRLWKDPDSIKSASIATPQPHLSYMWHVCVRLNAKNSFGGYIGERESMVAIYDNGEPPKVLMENAALNCEGLPHEPFPELEGGRPVAPQAKR